MKKVFFLLLILNFSFIKPTFSMDPWVDSTPEEIEALHAQLTRQEPLSFKDIPFGKGHQFNGQRVSLKCTEATYSPQLETAGRDFSICLREGEKIGLLRTSYRPRDKDMHIGYIEIFAPFQKRGYAGDAIRVLMEAYRLPLLQDIDVDYFTGSVLLSKNMFAPFAVKVFEKLQAEATNVSDLSIHYRIKRAK